MSNPQKALNHLVQMVAQTTETEYACDEVLRLLDAFVECVLRGEHAAQMMPLVQKHLDICADCREEYEALLRVMRAIGPQLSKQRTP
jgi:predicted anti-sigma-YlaC factor YlaD